MQRTRSTRRIRVQRGFTLVELIIVIVLSGALAMLVMQFITAPVDAYVDQSRRARLVDVARLATAGIAADIHRALPNSIRVGCAGRCVEMLRVATAGRYRAGPPGDTLSFVPTDADTSFDVVGPLNDIGSLTASSSPTACVNGSAACVVVYNTGYAGTDAWNADHMGGGWQPDNLATLSGVSASSISFVNSHFSSGQSAFPAASPQQRFYIVDSPVSFHCDAGGETLRRYDGYNITHQQTAVDEHAELIALSNPAEHALVANQVTDCQFIYAAGTPSRNGLLTARITIGEAGEVVTLTQQFRVPNMP